MNQKQRQILFFFVLNLIIFSVLAFSSLVLYLSDVISTLYIVGSAGCVIWYSFIWLIPTSKRLRNRPNAFMDERDILISRKSAFAGYIGIWLYFIAVCIVLWFVAGPDGSVPIGVFPALLYLGMGVFVIVSSIAALLFYKEDKDAIEGGIA